MKIICRTSCWTPVPCPECGNSLPPRGRSVPLEVNLPSCCERHRHDSSNPRHLWSVDEAEDYADLMLARPKPEPWTEAER